MRMGEQKAYYRRMGDKVLWAEFERLAVRLGLSVSGALTAAAREWTTRHKDDPLPETEVRGQHRSHRPGTTDPFAAAEKERDNT